MNPRLCTMLTALSLAAAAHVASAAPPVINEFVANHLGTDDHEFVEIFGDPSTSYSTLTILQIEGDGLASGMIDSATPVGTTDGGGYWMTGYLTGIIENGTVTLLLVENFTGVIGNDLDTNNDGVFDSTPFDAILDAVALHDGGFFDHTYGTPVLTPGFDGRVFLPGGASRIPNGTDTNGVSDWTRNDFGGRGLPGFTGTPTVGEALNTPGAENQLFVPPPDPVINEFVFNHTGIDDHEYLEVFGEPDTDYSHLTIISVEGDGASAGIIDAIIPVGTTNANGFWTTPFLNETLENGSNTLLLGEGFFGAVGQDLDTNNDGVLNTNPFARPVDDVAVKNGNVTDLTYSISALTQGYDGNASTVGGASRLPNGTDTDAVADWVRNDFDGDGLVGFTGTPALGEARNTPGTINLTAIDLTPPVITVTMTPSVLWPPRHNMLTVCATVTVSDEREPAPTFVLTSITSNEDPDGLGDGNTEVDIDADFNTADLCFMLRAERAGGGDGRVYTIVYTATDGAGNQATGTAVVRVPHDQSGAALASQGFTTDGTSLDSSTQSFAIVIPSIPSLLSRGMGDEETMYVEGMDASQIDPFLAFVGNNWGVLRPVSSTVTDVNGDYVADLVLYYPTSDVLRLTSRHSAKELPPSDEGGTAVSKVVGLHFESLDGTQYLVEDIFALGTPVSLVSGTAPKTMGAPVVEGRSVPAAGVTIHPNPFNPSTTISLDVAVSGRVVLRVFDVRGAVVRTLRDEPMAAGHYDVPWNGRDDGGRTVSSGVYFVRLEAAGLRTTHRAVLLK